MDLIIHNLETGEKENVGCFELPNTIDGCLDAAIEAEKNGEIKKVWFLLGMAETMMEEAE